MLRGQRQWWMERRSIPVGPTSDGSAPMLVVVWRRAHSQERTLAGGPCHDLHTDFWVLMALLRIHPPSTVLS